MKKLFSLLVAGTMMLGMVACAPKTGTDSKKPAESNNCLLYTSDAADDHNSV